MINKRFIAVKEENEMMIQELFNNRKNVNAIPVIDNENKLLREYYRYNEDIESGKNRISFDIVKKIYHEAMLMPYCIIYFRYIIREREKLKIFLIKQIIKY